MQTLILINVTDNAHKSEIGLYYIIVEGDWSNLNGFDQPRTPIGDPRYKELAYLLFRQPHPGEIYREPFKDEVKQMKSFPVFNGLIICVEIWRH